ncbi:hypothetical protein JW933_10185 [candidate division FCPU426 bacterium]|nr:hypothetical protein [candidate division FCPU426 bacterium]
MRKVLIAAIGIALIGLASSSFAALGYQHGQTIDFPITITVGSTYELEATVEAQSWGTIPYGTDNFSNQGYGMPRAVVRNIGFLPCTLQAVGNVWAGSEPTTWTMGTTIGSAANNQGVLAGIFTVANDSTQGGRDLVLGDFGDEDVLPISTASGGPATPLKATDTILASATDPATVNGVNVPWGDERTMRFLCQSPTEGTLTAGIQQEITVTIVADAL